MDFEIEPRANDTCLWVSQSLFLWFSIQRKYSGEGVDSSADQHWCWCQIKPFGSESDMCHRCRHSKATRSTQILKMWNPSGAENQLAFAANSIWPLPWAWPWTEIREMFPHAMCPFRILCKKSLRKSRCKVAAAALCGDGWSQVGDNYSFQFLVCKRSCISCISHPFRCLQCQFWIYIYIYIWESF